MKFCGMIGFGVTEETSPGIWENVVTERRYFGDVLKNTRQAETGQNINDNLKINNSISVVADEYLNTSFGNILYVEWMGQHWKVTNVEVQRPRLILQIGGVYNGD